MLMMPALGPVSWRVAADAHDARFVGPSPQGGSQLMLMMLALWGPSPEGASQLMLMRRALRPVS